jgi:RNA polymerase sigma-70 factor (ECF subfamily)
MNDADFLAERFEAQRDRLRAVAYRMLGSRSEAEDAVQEAWLRLSHTDERQIDNLRAWLTTVVARVCLNMLRSRRRHPEQPAGMQMPEPIVSATQAASPEDEALVADGVGLALLVVLDTLTAPERLAFVLHDLFDVSFNEIAPMIDRTPEATRQLASRARRRVRGQAPAPDADIARQHEVVDAFFAAAHAGDFDRLVSILHPDVVLRSDGGPGRPIASMVVHGAQAVAQSTGTFARLSPYAQPVIVNGVAGALVAPQGRPYSVMAFTVLEGRIAAIDVLADPDRLRQLDVNLG